MTSSNAALLALGRVVFFARGQSATCFDFMNRFMFAFSSFRSRSAAHRDVLGLLERRDAQTLDSDIVLGRRAPGSRPEDTLPRFHCTPVPADQDITVIELRSSCSPFHEQYDAQTSTTAKKREWCSPTRFLAPPASGSGSVAVTAATTAAAMVSRPWSRNRPVPRCSPSSSPSSPRKVSPGGPRTHHLQPHALLDPLAALLRRRRTAQTS
ncbi:hypothetical protein DFJ74DRAFT_665691 [Hyaloraphidium curvatum]|nr:hypothetical protein DFJ74DRAFT_665691 [Hyaloraphidium curvatum]